MRTRGDAHSHSLWWLRSPDTDEPRQVSIMTPQAGGTWRDVEGRGSAACLISFHRFVTAHDADVGLSHLVFPSVKRLLCVFSSQQRDARPPSSAALSVLKTYCHCHGICSVMFPDYLGTRISRFLGTRF